MARPAKLLPHQIARHVAALTERLDRPPNAEQLAEAIGVSYCTGRKYMRAYRRATVCPSCAGSGVIHVSAPKQDGHDGRCGTSAAADAGTASGILEGVGSGG